MPKSLMALTETWLAEWRVGTAKTSLGMRRSGSLEKISKVLWASGGEGEESV